MWPLLLSFLLGILSTIAVEYALVRLAESARREQPSMGDRGNGSKPYRVSDLKEALNER